MLVSNKTKPWTLQPHLWWLPKTPSLCSHSFPLLVDINSFCQSSIRSYLIYQHPFLMVHWGGLMAKQHILSPWPQWLVQGWVYGPSQANQSQFWKKSLSAGAAEDHVAPACKEPGRMKPAWRQHRDDVLLDPDDIICSRDPACLELELSPHFQCTSHKVPSYV